MTRILIIDDEPIFRKMIEHALSGIDCQLLMASDGKEGMELARSSPPDMIITDVVMPEMDGYTFTRLLRRLPGLEHVPLLVLTTQNELEDRVKAFEAGADGYLAKPFSPTELLAWVQALLRRGEAEKTVMLDHPRTSDVRPWIIAVHSLRGGVGCTSMSVNLGLAFRNLWACSSLIMDTVLPAGTVALMLNQSLRRTWADIANYPPEDLDLEVLEAITIRHESGLHYIASPTNPIEAETLTPNMLKQVINRLKNQYEYIILDIPHNFNDIALIALDIADVIIHILAPEMASFRAAAASLQTYQELNYPPEKIKVVLNLTLERYGLTRQQIEKALHLPLNLIIPYIPEKIIPAINYGKPILFYKPNDDLSILIERFAFHLSKQSHRKQLPKHPTKALERILKSR